MAVKSFLTEQDLDTIRDRGEVRTYSKQAVILQQNATCDRIYWITRGVVQIDFSHLYNHDVLAYLGEGDLFGEISYLLGTDASANASAADEVETVEIEHESLRQLLTEDAELAARFYKTLSHTLARRVRSQNR